MPAGGQRAGFGLAIAHHAGHDQVGVVERRAVGVHQGITQFPAFVDGSGRFRRYVTGNAARERELGEQFFHALLVLGNSRISLAVAALQVSVGYYPRCAVTGTGDVNHVQVIFLDDPVEMDIDEVQTRCGAPVTHQARFHIFQRQRLFEQRIVE